MVYWKSDQNPWTKMDAGPSPAFLVPSVVMVMVKYWKLRSHALDRQQENEVEPGLLFHVHFLRLWPLCLCPRLDFNTVSPCVCVTLRQCDRVCECSCLEGIEAYPRPQWRERIHLGPHQRIIERNGWLAVLQEEHGTLSITDMLVH